MGRSRAASLFLPETLYYIQGLWLPSISPPRLSLNLHNSPMRQWGLSAPVVLILKAAAWATLLKHKSDNIFYSFFFSFKPECCQDLPITCGGCFLNLFKYRTLSTHTPFLMTLTLKVPLLSADCPGICLLARSVTCSSISRVYCTLEFRSKGRFSLMIFQQRYFPAGAEDFTPLGNM